MGCSPFVFGCNFCGATGLNWYVFLVGSIKLTLITLTFSAYWLLFLLPLNYTWWNVTTLLLRWLWQIWKGISRVQSFAGGVIVCISISGFDACSLLWLFDDLGLDSKYSSQFVIHHLQIAWSTYILMKCLKRPVTFWRSHKLDWIVGTWVRDCCWAVFLFWNGMPQINSPIVGHSKSESLWNLTVDHKDTTRCILVLSFSHFSLSTCTISLLWFSGLLFVANWVWNLTTLLSSTC